VPKSKGRKPKKRANNGRVVMRPVVPLARDAWAPPARGRYEPGRLNSMTEDHLTSLLFSGKAAPDLMVELLPSVLWVYHMTGQRANMCVSGSMILHYAYAQLGIVAEPRAVDLVVSDERTGKRIMYGRPDPYWDGETFFGHCVLWLPGSRRFVDATVEQYPEIRRYKLGPIVGRTAAVGGGPAAQAAIDRGELPPGTHIGVQRNDMLLLYTAVHEDFRDVVTTAPVVRDNIELARRAGINLASHALALWRLPEVVDRIRQAPCPRLHTLLDAIGNAEASVDENGDFRFALASADGHVTNQRLDDIAVPDTAYMSGSLQPLDSSVGRLATSLNSPGVQEILDSVNTQARAVLTFDSAMGSASLPVVLFEPLQAVGISTRAGPSREAQAEAIIQAGFTRFLLDLASGPAHLADWSVRRTATGLELWDAGGIWARAEFEVDDAWLAEAAAHGSVLVIYGVRVGVHAPHGRDTYTESDRQTELQNSRRAGIVAAATIPWTGTPKPPGLLGRLRVHRFRDTRNQQGPRP
jgi:hypothetical protein